VEPPAWCLQWMPSAGTDAGPGLHPAEMAWIPPLATMVAIVAGVLVAWFVAALILSRAPGGERCPPRTEVENARMPGASGLPGRNPQITPVGA
jgi:hypothetical protein